VPTKVYRTLLPASLDDVWAFHSDTKALMVLTPAKWKIELLSDDLAVRAGNIIRTRVRKFGVPMEWHARIESVTPPHQFVDVSDKGPFPKWRHTHAFEPGEGGTWMTDTIEYEAPGGPLRGLINALVVSGDLDRLFAYRHQATREYLAKITAPVG
jgi:ligand-binding SRPBCC domain-containing protein